MKEGAHSRVFPNLRRMHEYNNLPLHKQLSFYFFTFHTIEIFHGNMGTYKIWWSSPRIMIISCYVLEHVECMHVVVSFIFWLEHVIGKSGHFLLVVKR
jgi:hypothetical protein